MHNYVLLLYHVASIYYMHVGLQNVVAWRYFWNIWELRNIHDSTVSVATCGGLFDNLGISQKDKKNWFAVNWGICKLRQFYWENHHEASDFGNIPKPNPQCIPYLATHWLSVNICPLWLGFYTAGTDLFCGLFQYFVLEPWPRGIHKPELYSCSVESFQRKLSSMNDGTAFITRLNNRECSYHQCEQTKLTMTIILKFKEHELCVLFFLQTLCVYTFIIMDSYYH